MLFFCSGAYADLKDPTEPVRIISEAKKGVPRVVSNFVLNAVLISGSHRLAVINNRILKVGDTLGDAKIKSIEPYTVKLMGGHREIVLHLFDSSIKEPSK